MPLGLGAAGAPYCSIMVAGDVIVPALVAGNACLLKHSRRTPGIGEHFRRAFEEMRRVVVGGAPVVALELTVPGGRIVRWGHRLYTRVFVPMAGRVLAGSGEADGRGVSLGICRTR